jgi:hypothetical protein
MRVSPLLALSVCLAAALSIAGCNDGKGGDDDDAPETHHHFVADQILVPTNPQMADDFGFDLDDDTTPDNQLGNLHSSLGNIDVQSLADELVLRGELNLLVDLAADDLTASGRGDLRTYEGENPSPSPCTIQTDLATCGHHLDGTGLFDLAAGANATPFVEGDLAASSYSGDDGALTITLPIFDSFGTVHLVNAAAELTTVSASGFASGRIGGAIPSSEVSSVIVPKFHDFVSAVISRDCTGNPPPTCGCMADSTGETLLGLFDDDDDCAVPLAEFENAALTQTLLAPDVDTDGDATKDAFSVGVGVSAVAATFDDPL